MNRRPIMPPAYLLFHLIGMVVLHFALPIMRWIERPWSYAGVLPIGVGLALVVGCALLFQKRGTAIKPFQVSSVLVTSGPFRFSRNPIYLGMVLILLGTSILLGTATPPILIPLFVILITQRFIRPEEAMLEQRFGSEYLAYRARVRRWI